MKTPPSCNLPGRSPPPSFTLIELMAASTVLSIVLLMMVGMQDQMSRAWSNANRRTDATREARAACRLMAQDFSCLAMRTTPSIRTMMMAPSVTNAPVSFFYYSGSGSGGLSIPSNAPGTSYLFAVIPRRPRSANETDFGLIGYYVASDTATDINGFTRTNYNLHRYYKISNADTVPAFQGWINTGQATSLFTGINPANDDILARNVCNLQIKVFGSTNLASGLNNVIPYGTSVSNGIYIGNKMHFELTFYPDDIAQKLTPLSAWTNSSNLQKYARSFEFRVDCNENNN